MHTRPDTIGATLVQIASCSRDAAVVVVQHDHLELALPDQFECEIAGLRPRRDAIAVPEPGSLENMGGHFSDGFVSRVLGILSTRNGQG